MFKLKSKTARLAAIAVCLFLPSAARGERLPVRVYTASDGLAQERVKRIVRDSRGFLWFCTADGLSRFDGYRFRSYGREDGLPHSSVNDLVETGAGDFWVATNGGGVARYDPSAGASEARFRHYPVGEDSRTNRVNRLFEDSSGRLWAGTDDGLFVLEGNQGAEGRGAFARIEGAFRGPPGRIVPVWAFAEDRHGRLWVGSGAGLSRRTPGGSFEAYPDPSQPEAGIRPRSVTVWDLTTDSDGRVWVAYTGGLLVARPAPPGGVPWFLSERVPEDKVTRRFLLPSLTGEAYRYSASHGLAHDDVRVVHAASDGRVWAGTARGLSELADGRFRTYTTAHGLSDNLLRALAEDRDGNLWVGGETGGALKIVRGGLVTYGEADGLPRVRVRDIFEDRAGALCVLTAEGPLVHCLDRARGSFQPVRPNLPADFDGPVHVLQDREGAWWVAAGRELYRFGANDSAASLSGTRPKRYTAAEGLSGEVIVRLFEDSRGDVWLGTLGRTVLTRWERAADTFRHFSKADGLPEMSEPLGFVEDREGGVWVGFREGGLARFRDGRFRMLSARDGLPGGEMRRLFLDRAGRLWVGSSSDGLAWVEGLKDETPSVRRYPNEADLSSTIVRSITDDELGRLYVGTSRGVDRLELALNDSSLERDRVKRYTTADGLASNESETAYRDRAGALWFGMWQGLSKLLPERAGSRSRPPPVFIGALRVPNLSRPVGDFGETLIEGLELTHAQNQVEIDFLGIAFGPGEVLRFDYRLEGAGGGDEWKTTDQRGVTYANLAPGSYRFTVRARTADGVTSLQPAVVSFRILRPVWQRWWFLALVALSVGAVVYLVDRYRVRRLLEIERVRTRIATDLHDDIGASLSQIAILSEVVSRRVALSDGEGPAGVREPLATIAHTSREMVDSMSDIVWAINPKRDRLSDLTQRMRRFASDTLSARDIRLRFSAPEASRDITVGADLRREIYLIFKESVNNLVKHSRCTEAAVDFRIEAGRLVVSVTDDGVGFDPEEVARDDGDGARGMGGHGLQSLRRRAENLGGAYEVRSARGAGASVTLSVPVKIKSRRRPAAWRKLLRR